MAPLLELFWSFFKIGGLTFGGGYMMLPLFEREIVEVHRWLTPAEFADATALAATAPGPIAVNIATYAGFKVGGVGGAITGALAVVLPAFLIMLTLLLFFTKIYQYPRVQGIFIGLKPAVVGMLAAVVITLGRSSAFDFKTGAITLSAFALLMFSKISPVLVLLAAGIVGFTFF